MNPFDSGYYFEDELRSMGFRSVGREVQIAKSANIIGLGNISIANKVRIDGFCNIIAAGGDLTIGSYVHIGAFCHISAGGGVELKDFAGMSQGVRIYSGSDDYSGSSLTNPMVPKEFKTERVARVTLGRHVIIGSGSTVLPGVSIGDYSCVGAHSLVTKSLDTWGMFGGVPTKLIKERSRELIELENAFLENERATGRG
jgi:acetyltransferase-like isoleucine patch superfamily enzyme